MIDAHLHVWDTGRLTYPWLASAFGLPRRFVLGDLEVGAVPLESVVIVQADCLVGQAWDEVDWDLGLPAPSVRVAGMIAAAQLDRPGGAADVRRYRTVGKVKGVRQLLQDEPPGRVIDPALVAGVRELATGSLVFDLCVRSQQLRETTSLVEQCPQVTFVLDHLGKPEVGPEPDRSWRTDLGRLAALPNVNCKLSGLSSETVGSSQESSGTGIFRPYLRHALDAFGPGRCMFGSDWPVASSTISYEGWFDQVLDAAAALDAAELADVLSGTATRIYQLDFAADETKGR